MANPVTIPYPCGYYSHNEFKSRSVSYHAQVQIINNTDTIDRMTQQEIEHYQEVVFNAVVKNPEGSITDIYLDIMTIDAERLGRNKNFNYEYQANYHRAYIEVNGSPYEYGGTIKLKAQNHHTMHHTMLPNNDCCKS